MIGFLTSQHSYILYVLFLFYFIKNIFFFIFIQGLKMYKVLTSLWSRSSTSTHNKTRLSSITSSDLSINEDDWVLVSDNS